MADWNQRGYLPTRFGPSFFELLHRTFERRKMAELSGDKALANKLKQRGTAMLAALKLPENNGPAPTYARLVDFEALIFKDER
jgi:hypothetical protein